MGVALRRFGFSSKTKGFQIEVSIPSSSYAVTFPISATSNSVGVNWGDGSTSTISNGNSNHSF